MPNPACGINCEYWFTISFRKVPESRLASRHCFLKVSVFLVHSQSVTVKEYTRVVHNVFSFETIIVKQPIGGTNTESLGFIDSFGNPPRINNDIFNQPSQLSESHK